MLFYQIIYWTQKLLIHDLDIFYDFFDRFGRISAIGIFNNFLSIQRSRYYSCSISSTILLVDNLVFPISLSLYVILLLYFQCLNNVDRINLVFSSFITKQLALARNIVPSVIAGTYWYLMESKTCRWFLLVNIIFI